jgi:predicted nucleic acid-binding protein
LSAIVLDASAAIAFLVPSQKTPQSSALLAEAARLDLTAPSVFGLEVRHALVKMERRGLVGPAALDADLPALESTLEIASPLSGAGMVAVTALARAERLGVYDAIYLELALREGAVLASRDVALVEAAQRRGAAVRDLR